MGQNSNVGFQTIIIKFDIYWFSNWKLNWKPITKWAPFENHPTLEKLTINWHFFEIFIFLKTTIILCHSWFFENLKIGGYMGIYPSCYLTNIYIFLSRNHPTLIFAFFFVFCQTFHLFLSFYDFLNYIHTTKHQKLITFIKLCDKGHAFALMCSTLDIMVTNEWFARILSIKRSVRYLISFPSYAIFGSIASIMLH
jgi:hypothetical protein